MKGTEIGYILYSDMTRSKNLTSGKTPIGIVVCSYENNTGGQAMALKTIGNLSWEKTSIWNSGKDIPELENLESTGAAVMDIKSCNNTNIITNAGNSSQYPAAWATKDYSTAGTSAGDWCLPAAGIFRSIDYFLDLVNSGFSLVGGEKLGRASYLWSSTEMEFDNSNRSMFDSNLYGLYPVTKGSSYEVRPVIPFCQEGYSYDYDTNTCKEKPKVVWGQCTGAAQSCNIGDIVYSDGTCSPQKVSGKTPIAVVVYKSPDGNCAQAVALNSIGDYIWGSYDLDISTLQNFTSAPDASQDLASCENTTKIIAADKRTDLAAWAAKLYNTTGTEPGDWCLPAAGIITSIKNNMSTINNGFNLAGGAQIETYSAYWSSTESNSKGAWNSGFNYDYGLDGFSYGSNKPNNNEVRPVIEF